VRLNKQQDLGRFLVEMVDEFRVELPRESSSNNDKKGDVRLQDRLQALRGWGDQGVLCWRAYKHFRRCGIKPDLGVIMRGLLPPQDISDVEEKAEAIRENCSTVLERKNVASQTFVGRGLLLIAISLIKHSWYTEMKKGFKRKMNLDDSDDEYEAGTDDDDDDDEEDGAKKKPNALVVRRWKMILPKRGEVPKTGMKKLCETVLMKEL